jgi:hypothetical protein
VQKFLLKTKILSFVAVAMVFSVALSQPVFATCDVPADYQQISINIPGAEKQSDGSYCFRVRGDANGDGVVDINDNPIINILKGFAQFLAVGVGLAVVGGIIFGGFTYMTARADAGQTQKGEEIIRNAIIGLLLYIFMFALLNWVIPGGIFA